MTERFWVARLLGALLVVAAMAGRVAPGAAAARQESEPVDLAAMALTPDDAAAGGLDGYGAAYGWLLTPEQEAARTAANRDLPEDEVLDELEDAGLVRVHQTRLALPSQPGNGDSRTVSGFAGYVYEFADAAGAAASFDFVANRDADDVEEVAGSETIGEESVLVRYEVIDGATGDRAEYLASSTRVGRFHLRLALFDFGRPDEGVAPEEPEIEVAEALAERFVERVEAVLEDGAPGLSLRVARMDAPRPMTFVEADRYLALDGDAFAFYGFRSADERRFDRLVREWGILDLYSFEQSIPTGSDDDPEDPYYLMRLYRFQDEGAAEFWMVDALAAVENDSTMERFEPVGGLDDLGDESAVAEIREDYRGGVLDGYAIVVRVGNVVAELRLMSGDGVEVDTALELMDVQIGCLEDGPCPDPMHEPDGLRGRER